MARQVLDLEADLASLGIAPWVYQIHTLTPLDLDLVDELARTVRAILVLEEASPIASLALQVRERVISDPVPAGWNGWVLATHSPWAIRPERT